MKKTSNIVNKTILVNISIYNVLGIKVKELINSKLSVGSHSLSWNGMNDLNCEVPAGIYFCRMITSSGNKGKKILWLP